MKTGPHLEPCWEVPYRITNKWVSEITLAIKLLQYIDFDCTKKDEEDKFIFIEDFEAPSEIRSKSILKDLVKDIQSESLPMMNKKAPYHTKANQKSSSSKEQATSNKSSVPSDKKNKRKPKNPNVKDKKEANK